QQRLGTTVIIENRAGGGGSIGTAAVAKSSPDGSSWLMVFDNHAANPFVFPNLPFNTETDLDPVQLIGTALCAVDESSKAIQDTGRCGHRGKGQTGHAELRNGRSRQHRSPRDGAVVERGGRATRARTVSRRWPRHERSHRRAC